MKQNYLFFACLVTCLVQACQKPDEGIGTLQNPEITILAEQPLIVPAQGGDFNVAFTVKNSRTDGAMTAGTDNADWIKGISINADNVEFHVSTNDMGDIRTGIVTLAYKYGGDSTATADVTISQEKLTSPEYDYVFNATIASGAYYGDQYSNEPGQMNYSVCLSDREVTEENILGGNFYFLDIFASEPEDLANVRVPEGTYTLGQSGTTSIGDINPDYTYAYYTDPADGNTYEANFSEVMLTVSYDGDNALYSAVLTDTDGQTHYVTFSGKAVIGLDLPERKLDRDLDFTASYTSASYLYHYGDILEVGLDFTDMEIDADGKMVPPGSWIVVDMIQPYNEWGMLERGYYPVKSTPEEPFTVVPGDSWYISYAIYVDEYGTMHRDNITGGSMTIEMSDPDTYNISCDFTTESGYTAKCTWTGYIEIAEMPSGGSKSTLTGDYELNLSEAEGSANYFNNMYGTGGLEWMITLDQQNGDAVQIHLFSESIDPNDGIGTGKYTVNTDGYPRPGEWRDGLIDGFYSIGGTWFIGKQDGMPNPEMMAPAVSGDLEITNHGDGTYDIVFAFNDDHQTPYMFSGQYHGPLDIDIFTESTSRISCGKQQTASFWKQSAEERRIAVRQFDFADKIR